MALATIRGDKTLAELAEHFAMHPDQLSEWTQQLTAYAAAVFDRTPRAKAAAPDFKALHATMEPLTLEKDAEQETPTRRVAGRSPLPVHADEADGDVKTELLRN